MSAPFAKDRGEQVHLRERHLEEVADGAWGDGARTRGHAQRNLEMLHNDRARREGNPS